MSDKVSTALRWKAITPSDTAPIEPRPVAVFVGGGGTVTAIGDDGVSGAFVAVAGQVLQIQPNKVMATGTDATDLVALYN